MVTKSSMAIRDIYLTWAPGHAGRLDSRNSCDAGNHAPIFDECFRPSLAPFIADTTPQFELARRLKLKKQFGHALWR